MRLLQRYVLFELLRVFTFVLSVLTVLLVFVGVIREVSENGLGPHQVLKILPYVAPSLLPFTIPATLLLTVCVVFGRISGDQEVTAAKSAGISVLSLLMPSFWLGTALALCSLVLSDQVIPWAVGNIQRTVTAAMEDIFLDILRSQHQVVDSDRGYSISVMDVKDKTLIMPTFQYAPSGRDPVIVQAAEATLDFDVENHQVMLKLVRAHVDVPGGDGAWLEEDERPFPLPHSIQAPKPRHLSIRDIRRRSKELAADALRIQTRSDMEAALALTTGSFDRFTDPEFVQFTFGLQYGVGDVARLTTEIHSRFALSASCFFFALVGGPFAIQQGKRQFLTSFFMCFLPILLIYYPIVLLMMNLSKTGTVSAAWSMWIGNFVLLIVGVVILRKVLQH